MIADLHIDQMYCINLPSRADRRAHAAQQFARYSLPVEFVEAVDGRLIDYKKISPDHTPGMVGCFLSHRKIFKDAIDRRLNRIMVWEDDAMLAPHFDKLLHRAIPQLPEDWHFAYLGFTHYNGFYSYQQKVNDYWVVPGNGWGTQCYMVNGLDTIKRLYQQTENMLLQIDEQLNQVILPHGFNYYFIQPCAVYQAELISDVQTQRHNTK